MRWLRRHSDSKALTVRTILLGAAAALAGTAAFALQGALPGMEAPQERACDARAYVADPDPAGFNVRAGPSAAAPVLGVIPRQHAGTIVHMVAARDGWFRIDRAEVIPLDDTQVRPPVQRGWVFGRLLAVDPQADAYGRRGGGLFLYQEPDTASARVHRLRGSRVALLDCHGAWLRVVARYPTGERATGWLHPNDYCSNPVTTCP